MVRFAPVDPDQEDRKNQQTEEEGGQALFEATSASTAQESPRPRARTGRRPQRPGKDPSEPAQAGQGSSDVMDGDGRRQLSVIRGSGSKRRHEYYIPVHGLVRLTPQEVTITNHPAFQRLGEIHQLGQVNLVYRGATHRRLEHALGTLRVAQMMIESINTNSEPRPENGGQWVLDAALTEEEESFTRLGALLHDIGHLPAGHTLEDEFGLLDSHDDEERLNLVLNRTHWYGVPVVPTLHELIDELYAETAARIGPDLKATDVLLHLISKGRASTQTIGDSSFRLAVCRDIIGNTICADLLDYLHRDWYHLGKQRHFDTRLFEYMEVRRATDDPGNHPRSSLVIFLRRKDEIRLDAVTAILDLLESRYQLGEIALFHHTKLTAAAMLERVLAEIGDALGDQPQEWLRTLVEELLDSSDAQMLHVLRNRAEELAKSVPGKSDGLTGAAGIADALRLRRLYKRVLVNFEKQLGDHAIDVQHTYGGSEGRLNRLQACRQLESDFGLPPGSMVMYCPKRGMHTKIAEVRILVDGNVHTLDEYEKEHLDLGLTGGYLEAQKTRFLRLWRIHIALERDTHARLEKDGQLGTLLRAIDALVLGRTLGGLSFEQNSLSIARELAAIKGSSLEGKPLQEIGVAERGRPFSTYPTGAPTLVSHVVGE